MTESNEQKPQSEVRAQRIANMEKLQEMGYEPFGRAYETDGLLAEIRAAFEVEKTVKVAGRIVAKRPMGKSMFIHIQDGTDRMQLYVQKNVIGEEAYAAFKVLDIGDQIGIEGLCFVTRTEEQSLKVQNWALLSKALLPLPEKWHGLQDVETRYRQRYLDLIANPDVRSHFDKRMAIVRSIRQFLWNRGFKEVETPMLQSMAGGAAATPFKTHYNALSTDMYMRIAPELYLKRLLVGGYEKVFELNRNFRNEGLSRRHNPEFTMLEIYQAYGNVESMRELIESMVTEIAEKVIGSMKIKWGEDEIDLTSPWRRVPYANLIKERAGDDWYELDIPTAIAKAKEMGVECQADWNHAEITNEVYEKAIERTLINPTFVTRLPAELVPLARACEDDPSVVDVFELEIGGCEVAPGYTELNDPIEQRRRFEEQAGEHTELIDEDFLTALEHGMPPAGGMGVGIDRLVMILTGAESIRDVILFPQLKPKV